MDAHSVSVCAGVEWGDGANAVAASVPFSCSNIPYSGAAAQTFGNALDAAHCVEPFSAPGAKADS